MYRHQLAEHVLVCVFRRLAEDGKGAFIFGDAGILRAAKSVIQAVGNHVFERASSSLSIAVDYIHPFVVGGSAVGWPACCYEQFGFERESVQFFGFGGREHGRGGIPVVLPVDVDGAAAEPAGEVRMAGEELHASMEIDTSLADESGPIGIAG